MNYEQRHKTSPQVFIRERKLPFKTVLQLLLRKSVKPLQLVLNEWTDNLDYQISASALSQARRKLKHTAFIELLEKCVVQVMYRVGEHERFKGKRLLALDGTSLRLPNTEETRERFGLIEHMSGSKQRASNQVEAKATILYDVLNEIPISGELARGRTYDLKASKPHLKNISRDDVLIADRAYGSYQFFTEILARNADFVIRCKKNTFEKQHGLFESSDQREKIVELSCPTKLTASTRDIALSLKVRFVRIPLDTGEIEVLATSLVDTKAFPYEDFKELYYKRWGIETYFHTLKSRLSIDNFTGKSVEAIMQDFYSTIFVSGLETIITCEANEELGSKATKHYQKVNKAIAFHTIKNKVVKMVFDPIPNAEDEIQKLFLQNPTLVRPYRDKPQRVPSTVDNKTRNSLYFQRYGRKHVF